MFMCYHFQQRRLHTSRALIYVVEERLSIATMQLKEVGQDSAPVMMNSVKNKSVVAIQLWKKTAAYVVRTRMFYLIKHKVSSPDL